MLQLNQYIGFIKQSQKHPSYLLWYGVQSTRDLGRSEEPVGTRGTAVNEVNAQ